MRESSKTYGTLHSVVIDQDDDEDGPELVVLLLHGYGATATDLVLVGRQLAARVPRVRVVLPAAPERVGAGSTAPAAGDRLQWWEIDVGASGDGRPMGSALDALERLPSPTREMSACAGRVAEAAAAACRDHPGPAPLPLVLGGFSQGAATALLAALVLPAEAALRGLALLSGFPAAGPHLRSHLPALRGLPVMLSRGEGDEVVLPQASACLEDLCRSSRLPVSTCVFEGGHEVHPRAVHAMLAFVQEHGTPGTRRHLARPGSRDASASAPSKSPQTKVTAGNLRGLFSKAAQESNARKLQVEEQSEEDTARALRLFDIPAIIEALFPPPAASPSPPTPEHPGLRCREGRMLPRPRAAAGPPCPSHCLRPPIPYRLYTACAPTPQAGGGAGPRCVVLHLPGRPSSPAARHCMVQEYLLRCGPGTAVLCCQYPSQPDTTCGTAPSEESVHGDGGCTAPAAENGDGDGGEEEEEKEEDEFGPFGPPRGLPPSADTRNSHPSSARHEGPLQWPRVSDLATLPGDILAELPGVLAAEGGARGGRAAVVVHGAGVGSIPAVQIARLAQTRRPRAGAGGTSGRDVAIDVAALVLEAGIGSLRDVPEVRGRIGCLAMEPFGTLDKLKTVEAPVCVLELEPGSGRARQAEALARAVQQGGVSRQQVCALRPEGPGAGQARSEQSDVNLFAQTAGWAARCVRESIST